MRKLKGIPQRLAYVLGGQWTRDVAWTVFTITLARYSPDIMGQIMLALSFGYIVRMVANAGLNDFLISTFARRDSRPLRLLGAVTCLKLVLLVLALVGTWFITGWQNYDTDLRYTVLAVTAGLGIDAISDSFFALCQARGRQDVEMRIRVPASLIGIGTGIICILMQAPPLMIAIYKPIESLLLLAISLKALGRNPLKNMNFQSLRTLTHTWRTGLIFTLISACAILYNKLNVFFLKHAGGDAAVGAYSVAWEFVDGLSILVSTALLAKVVFPLMAKLWETDKDAFKTLTAQSTKTLWAASMPLIYILCVESDRIITLVYGDAYHIAVTAQQLLTPCIATAFLHNLAAYAMISMREHKLLLAFYTSGLILNIILCAYLTQNMTHISTFLTDAFGIQKNLGPLEGAALAITLTKLWVAIGTVSFFQYKIKAIRPHQWLTIILIPCMAIALWQVLLPHTNRLIAEAAGLTPLLILLWKWRPPPPWEQKA